MSAEERKKWIERSLELASHEKFEIFEAFGEEEF
jgi:hypothetical protein